METVLKIVEDEETQLVNTVEIEEEETQFVNTLKSMLHTLPPLDNKDCIYRVPYGLRRVNEEAYTPMLVSIGPFHHGTRSLPNMEVHKQRYLNDFLKRTPEKNLEYYVGTLKGFEESARSCYAENIDFKRNDFIKMMLLDGCFIVEFLMKFSVDGLENKDDPIWNNGLMSDGIIRDMLLLENQLPSFILEHLFNLVEHGSHWGNFFLEFALRDVEIFSSDYKDMILPGATTSQAKHMLDLFVQYCTPQRTKLSPKNEGDILRIPNASRLQESGVKFTKCTRFGVKCLLDVIFANGSLEIPKLTFADNTETFLRNLTAYEQCDNGKTQYFSEYIYLMDCLIDTPNDVDILTEAGIINNLLGDNGEVAQIFNKLGSGLKFESGFYLRRLFEDVNDYCNRPWHAWKAKLKRDYFNSPWTIISVVAAFILLSLAIIQTVFSMLQFILE